MRSPLCTGRPPSRHRVCLGAMQTHRYWLEVNARDDLLLLCEYLPLWTLVGLVDVSNIFYFFPAGGRGRGESEAPGWGGGRFLLKIPGEGGFSHERGGGGEVPGGCLREIFGGGAKYSSSGPKCPPSRSDKRALRERERERESVCVCVCVCVCVRASEFS